MDVTKLAKAEDIRELAEKLPNHAYLCGLFDGRVRRAAEAEAMIAQTLHACVINLEKSGEAFSLREDGVFTTGGTGLVDNATACGTNATACGTLVERGCFVEEKRGDQTIIRMTQKLVDLLRGHLARK